ncbi:hypothetical protein [Jiulongibacter sediminis]|uniref:Uncharacterized protein n=1 Tax=Jiulongibacter sediminis TaxID=1605367 RepID=A0A0P7C3Q2_9BACT|nr:hypothetical protein [Jiulongibacter sediminis]KPM49274.1 hypothetical protein AFM12_01210 [Jiulongibacter sediminis]TBX26329.1 hypothetical protein TK44_01210 [Jiulongibacter sediminis]
MYKTFRIISLAIAGGLFLFSAVVFFLLSNQVITPERTSSMEIFKTMVPVAIVLGIGASYMIGNKLLRKAQQEKGFKNKMEKFQSLSIVKLALLEAPGLLAVAAALLTGEIQFLFIALALVIVMIIGIPTKEKLATQLKLSPSETNELMNS